MSINLPWIIFLLFISLFISNITQIKFIFSFFLTIKIWKLVIDNIPFESILYHFPLLVCSFMSNARCYFYLLWKSSKRDTHILFTISCSNHNYNFITYFFNFPKKSSINMNNSTIDDYIQEQLLCYLFLCFVK